MEQFVKKCGAAFSVIVITFSLAGCGQNNKTVSSVTPSPDTEAASVLYNIKTTQYFTNEPVAQKDMEMIVRAGVNAPSAMNGQPWHFSVITDSELLRGRQRTTRNWLRLKTTRQRLQTINQFRFTTSTTSATLPV